MKRLGYIPVKNLKTDPRVTSHNTGNLTSPQNDHGLQNSNSQKKKNYVSQTQLSMKKDSLPSNSSMAKKGSPEGLKVSQRKGSRGISSAHPAGKRPGIDNLHVGSQILRNTGSQK